MNKPIEDKNELLTVEPKGDCAVIKMFTADDKFLILMIAKAYVKSVLTNDS